ncbi:MAG: DUF2911 domain-containing protein [Chitinophagaceae bacterium]|nr:DUF2911 domain-containing protein [Chitinophagaceae bacterium]
MKKIFLLTAVIGFLFTQTTFAQDDKSKPPSPPAKASETISSGAVITIDYSQPGVKGRTIGKDLEPMEGQVWRTGANNATVFEISKDVTIEGKPLAAGKYGLFSVVKGGEWTIIFNKTWKQWGAFQYKEADDALRVTAKSSKAANFSERMTFLVDASGKVSLLWGDNLVSFQVK